jgi:hypothetical protein
MTAVRRQPFVQFAERVLRLEFTPPWRVLLRVAIDGEQPCDLEPEARELARQLFGPVDTIDPALRRVLVWRLGRASGKSTIAAALAIWVAVTADLSRVGRGHVPHAFVVSPTRPLAKITTGIARELARGTDVEPMVEESGDVPDGFLIRRHDGRTVAIQSVAAAKGGANVRGVDVLVLVLDESEFFAGADGDYAVTDADQISAAMPRLIGHVLCISTPWPTDNLTGELFDRNHGHAIDAFAALGPSMFMRPTPELAADIERETKRDPENAEREYNCVPGVRGGSRLFDVETLRACIVDARPLAIRATSGAFVAAGGDLGLERDSSAIAFVSNLAGEYELLETDEVRPTRSQALAPGYVIKSRFAPLMTTHGVRSITMDAHYRQSAIEHLSPLGFVFVDAPAGWQGKYDSYMFVRSLMRTGKLRLPNSPRLIGQLRAVTATPLPQHGTRISSPRRAGAGHGDVVSAFVLAVWAAHGAVDAAARQQASDEVRANIAESMAAIAGGGVSALIKRAEIEAVAQYDVDMREVRRETIENPAWQRREADAWQTFLDRGGVDRG